MVPYFPSSLLPLNYNDELRYHFFHYTTNYIGVGNKSKYFMNGDLFQSRHAFSDLLVGYKDPMYNALLPLKAVN